MFSIMKLISIDKSHRKNKKFVAVFKLGNKYKNVHFGDSRYKDYTQTGDKNKRYAYWNRHRKEISQSPDTPGILSLYVLWGDTADINKNIRIFKKLFNL